MSRNDHMKTCPALDVCYIADGKRYRSSFQKHLNNWNTLATGDNPTENWYKTIQKVKKMANKITKFLKILLICSSHLEPGWEVWVGEEEEGYPDKHVRLKPEVKGKKKSAFNINWLGWDLLFTLKILSIVSNL